MQQAYQTTELTCSIHPQSNIHSVQVSQQCQYKTRLACRQCMMEYQSMENFIELNDFLSIETLIAGLKHIQDCNHNICQYLLDSHDKQITRIEYFIQDIMTKFNELKQQLIEEQEYLKKTMELRIQYDAELINLKNKIQAVTQLDMDDYHQSKEWVELEQCVEQYVQLYYQPENQEIKVTLLALNANNIKKYDSQTVIDFRTNIKNTIDKYIVELSFHKFTQSILETTEFGNQIIDRITHRRRKQMKLIFSGKRDGMNGAAFWQHCENKGPTITICESKSGQTFGGYTPCKWINSKTYHKDASMTSFLFSFTKLQIFPLKAGQNAIYASSDFGPIFGGGMDLQIYSNFSGGQSILGVSYDVSQYLIGDNTTHLMGGQFPALVNMEVYQID